MSQGRQDSVLRVLGVAAAVCLVCSVVVSTAAVALRPAQEANRELDRKRNILVAAGMLDEGQTRNAAGADIEALFTEFEPRVVDLRTGAFTDRDPDSFDQLAAARDPGESTILTAAQDIATLSRREDHALIYLRRDDAGAIRQLVLPVRGYGLWGTLYGYLVLEGDLRTIAGIGFYEHQETPGLGGEVDNPSWKAEWVGKKIYDDRWQPSFEVTKSPAPEGSPQADYEVDALSGATLTSRGVENLINFWAGEMGYGPMIARLRQEGSGHVSG